MTPATPELVNNSPKLDYDFWNDFLSRNPDLQGWIEEKRPNKIVLGFYVDLIRESVGNGFLFFYIEADKPNKKKGSVDGNLDTLQTGFENFVLNELLQKGRLTHPQPLHPVVSLHRANEAILDRKVGDDTNWQRRRLTVCIEVQFEVPFNDPFDTTVNHA